MYRMLSIDNIDNHINLISKEESPETLCIKKNAYDNLSKEAKEVIKLITRPKEKEIRKLKSTKSKNNIYNLKEDGYDVLFSLDRLEIFFRNKWRRRTFGVCNECGKHKRYFHRREKLCRKCYFGSYIYIKRLKRKRLNHVQNVFSEVKSFLN